MVLGEQDEERVGTWCATHFGRVLDAVSSAGVGVAVYFADDAAAVLCSRRMVEFEGKSVTTRLERASWAEVILTATGATVDEVGSKCAAFGSVLDVASRDGEGSAATFSVAMQTRGAASAVVAALDGSRFDGNVVDAKLSISPSSPPRVYFDRNSLTESDEFSGQCARHGTVSSTQTTTKGEVIMTFENSLSASTCAASMRSLECQFSVKGTDDRLSAEFAAQVHPNVQETRPPRPVSPKKKSKLERAIEALRGMVAREPGDEKARVNLAGALLRVGGESAAKEALEHAQVAVETTPRWAWAHFRKGSALSALGDVARAATSLSLAARLAPDDASFEAVAARARESAASALDPLDAYVATEVDAAAAKDLVDAANSERRNKEEKKRKRPDEKDEDEDDGILDYNPRAHCYICKQYGHSKRDCPLARCQYCHEIGHRKSDCPLFTEALANAAEEEKKAKRKASYAKKKARKKEEWTRHLREQTGLEGFHVLYRVLGLPERRLATAAEIKKAYHRKSLFWHPDKHPDNVEEAHERFLEIKSAYELLVEGMEGGKLDGKTVHSAGDLTDAAASAQALQEKVNSLAEKVSQSKAWAG